MTVNHPRTPPEQITQDPMSELNYSGKREDWEDRLFYNHAYFTVAWKVGVGKLNKVEFPDYPSALEYVKRSRRAMLYCVSKGGRDFHIEEKRYEYFLDMWNKLVTK